MNEILHAVSYASAHASGALFSAIWEGAVLTGCVFLGLRLLPGLSAAARSVVWLNVFVLLVLLHFVPVFTAPASLPAESHSFTFHLDPRWSFALAALWLVLSLLRAAQLMAGMVHLRRLAGRAVPVPVNPEIKAILADAPRGRAAELCASDEVARPSVLGFFRPRILVPPTLVAALTPAELRQVILHEMEHLRRADDWTNLVQKVGLVLFPLNPVLLWVERQLCAERELACDDRVIHSSAGRKAYALCLTRLAEFSLLRRSFSLMLGAWERRPELVRRVHRILHQPLRTMGPKPAMAVTGGLLAGALGCAIALSHTPQLVSFVPVSAPVTLAQSLDPHAVARALGGTPQLVKAALPVPAAESRTRPAVLKAHRRTVNRAASLKAGLTPTPDLHQRILIAQSVARAGGSWDLHGVDEAALGQQTLAVLTEFTANEAQPKVVLSVSAGHRTPVAIPAAYYAIVPTADGWLIIKI